MIFSDRGKNHRSRSQRTGRTPCSVFCALFCALFFLSGCAGTANEAQDSALVFIRDRDFASAVEMIKNDIDAGNDTEGMYRLLGIAQMGIGDYSAAAGSFETALDRAGMFPGDIDYDINHVKEELADVMVYCIDMLDKLKLDADEIINAKMDKNEAKYPVAKAKGKSTKYDKL